MRESGIIPTMKGSRLKIFVLLLWGTILVVLSVLGVTVFASRDTAALLRPGQARLQGSPSLAVPPATITLTPSPAVIYLPSATARAATAMPMTATPTNGVLMPALSFSLTLPADVDPLTGLRVANPDIMNRRPVAVKISAFPRGMVRPVERGLSRADVVYEYYIGDDHLTRFIAVFYSQDAEHAGPVRSGRYFDEYVMRMYHSSLVFGHADKRVEEYLHNSDLAPLLFEENDSFFPPLWDSGSKDAETRLFVNTAGVGAKLADNSHQDLRATMFGPLLYPAALPAINRIYTHYSIYSYNYWQYDPNLHLYKRFSDAADATDFAQGEQYAPHIDNLTGQQVTTTNVVVLEVPHIFHNEFDRWDSLIDISLKGSGDAYIYRDGRMIKGTWIRDLVDQPIRFEDENSLPIPLEPGVTFYEVIDPESSIQQTGDSMDFYFSIPLRTVTLTPTPWGFVPTLTPRKSQK